MCPHLYAFRPALAVCSDEPQLLFHDATVVYIYIHIYYSCLFGSPFITVNYIIL